MIQFSRLDWMREERIELLCQIVLSTLPMVEESLTARAVGCHIKTAVALNLHNQLVKAMELCV
jgi:hypothetical protein